MRPKNTLIIMLVTTLFSCSSIHDGSNQEGNVKNTNNCLNELDGYDFSLEPFIYIQLFEQCRGAHEEISQVENYISSLILTGRYDKALSQAQEFFGDDSEIIYFIKKLE